MLLTVPEEEDCSITAGSCGMSFTRKSIHRDSNDIVTDVDWSIERIEMIDEVCEGSKSVYNKVCKAFSIQCTSLSPKESLPFDLIASECEDGEESHFCNGTEVIMVSRVLILAFRSTALGCEKIQANMIDKKTNSDLPGFFSGVIVLSCIHCHSFATLFVNFFSVMNESDRNIDQQGSMLEGSNELSNVNNPKNCNKQFSFTDSDLGDEEEGVELVAWGGLLRR